MSTTKSISNQIALVGQSADTGLSNCGDNAWHGELNHGHDNREQGHVNRAKKCGHGKQINGHGIKVVVNMMSMQVHSQPRLTMHASCENAHAPPPLWSASVPAAFIVYMLYGAARLVW